MIKGAYTILSLESGPLVKKKALLNKILNDFFCFCLIPPGKMALWLHKVGHAQVDNRSGRLESRDMTARSASYTAA